MPKIKKAKKNGLIKKPTIIDDNIDVPFLISLKDFDINQGDSFKEWETNGILSNVFGLLHGYSKENLTSLANSRKFTKYPGFPPKDKTDFIFPKYIQDDANWARIHLDGKHCIIGHIVKNIFYLVFLDGNHSFWKSTKKHT